MPTLIECVPNFSEGRDREKVEQIAATFETEKGVRLLDLHMDPDHNRSVMTVVGEPEKVAEAVLRSVGQAAALIDLNRHYGEHPRIGAADVVPFVPVKGLTLEDCVPLARRVGEEIYRRFRIPVYFYAAAALRTERRDLANIRRGGFEKLRIEVLVDPARCPDVGEPRLHPTAGATAVGARTYLIAFNVNLNCSERKVAQQIARAIRFSGGGLPGVKAVGLLLRSRIFQGQPGQAQVSMNLTDIEKTSLAQVFQAVLEEAARLGTSVADTELVGLIPQKALAGASPESLRLSNFVPRKILENRLAEIAAGS